MSLRSQITLAFALMISITLGSHVLANANSLVVDGPGFKVQNQKGWFGRKSTSYQDALGNKVEKNRGLFGRTTTRTSVLGTQTEKRGDNIMVKDANGASLVTSRKTLFGGKQTQVDANGILHSFKDLFQSP